MAISNAELIRIADSGKSLNKPKTVVSNEELMRIANSDRPDSISTMGGKFLTEHPFKSIFQPVAQTITGKSLTERSQEKSFFKEPPKNPLEFVGEFGAGLTRDVAAFGADVTTSPISLITGGLGALKPVQQVGKTIAGTKAGQAVGKVFGADVGKMVKNVLPKSAEDKIFNLYNYSVGGKLKNVGDVTKMKPQRISAMKTINENLPDIKFENVDTGVLESRIPQNRLDLLHSFKQTKKLVWDKINALSKGATEKSAEINLSSLADEAFRDTTKNIGKVALETNPNLLKGLKAELKKIKSAKKINPTQAEEYMKFLNNEVQRLRNSGQAVDYSVKDLYSNVLNKLNEATDESIIKSLGDSGYGIGRDQYSALKSAEKEILGAANKFLRQSGGQGGGITHPIINIWSLEEFLQGGVQAITGNVAGAVQSGVKGGLIRTAGKLADFFKSPDKRIPQMFKLMEKTYKRPPLRTTP